jgi:hypothetical protein
MDRGYNPEAIHRQIREDLHVNLITPIRSRNAGLQGGQVLSDNGSLIRGCQILKKDNVSGIWFLF